MTDPLTGKELVGKSYEYIEKLAKECAKALIEEFNNVHRKFQKDTLPKEVASDVIQWFEKRDKNIRLVFDSANVPSQQQNTAHLRFKGNTKDADFTITGTVGSFVALSQDKPISFVKTLVFSVDKNNFARRKV
ncbi:MAG: hypothetical protein M1368_04520 [Thaumarchaeota archaeon]|nr:hypothetical protein [Nitrososphaerota archaeon]